jgi:hypothetical protein
MIKGETKMTLTLIKVEELDKLTNGAWKKASMKDRERILELVKQWELGDTEREDE